MNIKNYFIQQDGKTWTGFLLFSATGGILKKKKKDRKRP